MPRSIDPGVIVIGGGLAASKSVDANALVHPTQGLDGLIVHITDPSKAHEARAIHVVDTPDNYASDEVEGALEELASGLSDSTQNGVVSGGLYTAVGLTITLTATVVRIGTSRILTGESVVLTNNAINWVYVTVAGALSVLTGATPPSISSPENVLLWKITTVAGAITASVDARFFVPNLDLKLPVTVREVGASPGKESEASFVTLEAAMLYLQYFNGNVLHKSKILVRGAITVGATVIVPTDDLCFEGEEGAEFITGAALSPMFDLNGKNRTQFKNLKFTCDHATSTAISDSVGAGRGTNFERCRIVSGSTDWDYGIQLDLNPTKVSIRHCEIAATLQGIRVASVDSLVIADCDITNPLGATTSNSFGLHLGTFGAIPSHTRPSEIRNNSVQGFETGVSAVGWNITISNNRIKDVGTGILVSAVFARISKNELWLDAAVGLIGVNVRDESVTIQLDGNRILNQRASGAYTPGDVPVGILASDALNAAVLSISDCEIIDFYNDTVPSTLGYGISLQGVNPRPTIAGCRISGAHIGIETATGSVDARISGCLITESLSGVGSSSVATGMVIPSAGASITDCTIRLDTVRGLNGILVTGTDCKIKGCNVILDRIVVGLDVPLGISADTGADRLYVSDCVVSGFYNTSSYVGTAVNIVAAVSPQVHNCVITTAGVGVAVGVGTTDLKASGLTITDVTQGMSIYGVRTQVSNSSIQLNSTSSSTGIRIEADDVKLHGVSVVSDRTVYAAETPYGIRIVDSNRPSIVDCRVHNFANTGNETGYGIYFQSTVPGTYVSPSVIGGSVTDCYMGIQCNDEYVGFKLDGTTLIVETQGVYTLGEQTLISNCPITLKATTGLLGVKISGSHSQISNCMIENLRTSYLADTSLRPIGIAIFQALAVLVEDVQVSNCVVKNFLNTDAVAPNFGIGISTGNRGGTATTGGNYDNVVITNCDISACVTGLSLRSTTTNAKISNTTVKEVEVGFTLAGTNKILTGCSVNLDVNRGLTGISSSGTNTIISDCTLQNTRVYTGAEIPRGISNTATGLKVDNCFIEGFNNTLSNLGQGIYIGSGSQDSINDTTIKSCYRGIEVNNGLTDWSVVGCRIESSVDTSIYADTDVARVKVANNQLHFSGSETGIYFGTGSNDFEISGNFVDGNAGATTNGILLAGNHFRFVISDNNIKGLGGGLGAKPAGIYIAGSHDGVISGNQVDGYLSATPYDPTLQVGIWVESSLSDPSRYLTVEGNTIQRTQHGIFVIGTPGDKVRDLVISDNVIHHCAKGAAGAFPGTFTSGPTMGIGMTYAESCQITGNNISFLGKVIDDAGAESFPTFANVGSQGVHIVNSQGISTLGNTIHDLYYQGAVTHAAGYGVFAEATGSESLTQLRINENTITHAVLGDNNGYGVYVSCSTASTLTDLMIAHNIVKGTDLSSIRIESPTSTTVSNLSVEHNTIQECSKLNTTTSCVDLQIKGNSTNLSITTNKFRNNLITGSTASLINTQFVTAGKISEHLTLSNNEVVNCYGHAIHAEATAALTSMSYIIVNNNTLTPNEGATVSTSTKGIHLDFGTTPTIRFIQINENVIRRTLEEGILIDASECDLLAEVSVCNNQVYDAGDDGISISAAETASSDTRRLQICDNQITSPTGVGIHLHATEVTENFNFREITIARNQIFDGADHGIRVHHSPDSAAATCNQLQIFENVVNDCGTVGRDFTFIVSNHWGLSLVLRGTTSHLTVTNNVLTNNAGPGFFLTLGVTDQDEWGAPSAGSREGTLESPLLSHNTARDNDTARTGFGPATRKDVVTAGTNWAPTNGINSLNIDSGEAPTGTWDGNSPGGPGWIRDNLTIV